MRTTSLGSSQIEVSAIALGTATFGLSPAEGVVSELVAAAIDLGVNFFDTANSYGNQPEYEWPGRPTAALRASSEELLGDALAGRADVVVASKVGEPLGSDRAAAEWRGNLTRTYIIDQCAMSRRRLKRDCIDVYYAHLPDPTTPLLETVSAFNELIERGDIREWAISNFSPELTREVVGVADAAGLRRPVANQIAYNVARRKEASDYGGTFAATGTSVVAYSPLEMGLLAGRGAAQRNWAGHARWGGSGFSTSEIEVATRFEEAADELGRSPVDLAVAWLVHQPMVASVVSGATSIRHLSDAAQAAALSLSAEQVEKIEAVILPSR